MLRQLTAQPLLDTVCKVLHIVWPAGHFPSSPQTELQYNRPRKTFGILEERASTKEPTTRRGQIFSADSGARMRKLRCILVVLAALVLSWSFAVPVEDDPETPFDESEALPCESNPVFSIMVQESARALQSVLIPALPPRVNPTTRRDETLAKQSARAPHPICDSVTILDHSLHC